MCQKFYYHRDETGKPKSTICLISENGWLARGVAICSDRDNFNRKVGRAIAMGRAAKALKNMESSDEINIGLDRDPYLSILMKLPPGIEKFKTCYDPFLTDHETKLIGATKRCGNLVDAKWGAL